MSVVVDYSVPAGAEGIDEAAIAYARTVWGNAVSGGWLIDYLNAYGVKATFAVPLAMARAFPESCLLYTSCFGARQFMKITGNEMWFGVPIEQLALLADDVELLLERRPDLKAQMDEPFDQVHVVTQHELDVQKAKGKLITKNK